MVPTQKQICFLLKSSFYQRYLITVKHQTWNLWLKSHVYCILHFSKKCIILYIRKKRNFYLLHYLPIMSVRREVTLPLEERFVNIIFHDCLILKILKKKIDNRFYFDLLMDTYNSILLHECLFIFLRFSKLFRLILIYFILAA